MSDGFWGAMFAALVSIVGIVSTWRHHHQRHEKHCDPPPPVRKRKKK